MSTYSSSKSGQSQRIGKTGKKEGSTSFQGGNIEENPFAIPKDEKIFTFKEEEKDRKNAEREENKNLKVWEKNRPTREGCLRKICETDIEPSALAINPKIQKKINVAEAGGFTIPIERPKNRENRYKLIEKKREMFLVSQMLETKEQEIQRLELHAYMRDDGLTCSERMLEQDTKQFIQFFNKIKEETTEAAKRVDELKKIKNQKTAEHRQISDECNALVSSINKNMESFQIFYNYKLFLDKLRPQEEQKMMEERKAEKKRRKEARLKQEYMGASSGPGKINDALQGKGKNRKEKKGGNQQSNQNGNDNEINIQEPYKEVIEDSDDDYPLNFSSPEELLEIFTILEEGNLFLIQQGQEAEQVLEQKKHEEEELMVKSKYELNKLDITEKEIQERTNFLKGGEKKVNKKNEGNAKNQLEKNFATEQEEDQLKTIDPVTFEKIDYEVRQLYSYIMTSNAEGKKENSSTLQLLMEIEKEIDNFLFDFNVADQIDHNYVTKESKVIQLEVRKLNREEKKRHDRLEGEEKQRKKQEEKNAKKFIKSGRPDMHRSSKPEVKRVKEVKKELTDAQLELKKYLEI